MNEESLRAVVDFVKSINPMTVGDLRKALDGLDDSLQILIGAPLEKSEHDWTLSDWWNVSHHIDLPTTADDSEFSAVTLYLSDNYDARQF